MRGLRYKMDAVVPTETRFNNPVSTDTSHLMVPLQLFLSPQTRRVNQTRFPINHAVIPTQTTCPTTFYKNWTKIQSLKRLFSFFTTNSNQISRFPYINLQSLSLLRIEDKPQTQFSIPFPTQTKQSSTPLTNILNWMVACYNTLSTKFQSEHQNCKWLHSQVMTVPDLPDFSKINELEFQDPYTFDKNSRRGRKRTRKINMDIDEDGLRNRKDSAVLLAEKKVLFRWY
ncbi:hypothetical protein BKA69DRAFT_330571 [Paraphysoderma sedebokerense]|nr:hypothetical protein BKA69DRAFT_330571 [Paraphysoderma sedebokerense]